MAGLIGLLFPGRCACCGQIVRKGDVCGECRETLRYVEPPICKRCGSALSDCHCKNRRYAFDRAVAAMEYEGSVKAGIKRFKFSGKIAAGRFLAEEMIRVIGREYGETRFDLLCAVPISKLGKKRRGYNHCDILCRHISRQTGVKFDRRALVKIKESRQQHFLPWQERQTNIAGVFAAEPSRVAGKTVLLADDIMTTGATLSECAAALKTAGAARVFCAAAAQTRLKRNDQT